MNGILAIALILSLQPIHKVQVTWSYPFNNSTYRAYICTDCSFDSIAETGNDYPEYDNISGATVTEVTLHGDVDDGTVTIVPNQPCWRITMLTDYSLLKRSWKDWECNQVFLPVVYGP